MNKTVQRVCYLTAYFLFAALVACLVVPIGAAGIYHALGFGLLMGLLVWVAQHIDQAAADRTDNSARKSVGVQLLAVMLIYVAMPTAVMALLHLLMPSVIVFTSSWQMLIGFLWMPLFLASLLQGIERLLARSQ